ncbi:MAG: hypothetical protein JWO08_75, partial [Verrucomicrobiaceae bacterium]|nr:hypothetical protein [Verrucomicrobiaceae bacterium]
MLRFSRNLSSSMKRFLLLLILCSAVRAEDAGLLLQLGLGDKEATEWDGSLKVSAGKVVEITGWRFERQDKVVGTEGWKAGTRAAAVQGRANNPKKLGMAKRAQQNLGPIQENGVFVRLQGVTTDSVVEVTTTQGNFSFKLADVKYGDPLELLDGRAAAVRTAVTGKRLSPERTEDDYPAIALGKKNKVYVTYQSFTPGIDRDERAKAWTEDPGDLSFLAKPAGGDQLWLQLREANKFSDAIAVTGTGCDIYKSAVAEDGKGTLWVVWSERKDGQFSIFARGYAEGKLGEPLKLSEGAGNNLSPVAVTDATGHVWAAWQGAEGTSFAIKAKHQTDAGWSETGKVSSGTGDCWQPSIAA